MHTDILAIHSRHRRVPAVPGDSAGAVVDGNDGREIMKERHIRFIAPEIRAILDGRKTQFREVVKPQPPETTERVARVSLMPPRADGSTHELWWDEYPADNHGAQK